MMRTVCEERTEHASGNGDSSQPDAQRAASRGATGGGGHGASSGVMHESTEVRKHDTTETNAEPERQNSVTPCETERVVRDLDARTMELPHLDSDVVEAKESKEHRVDKAKPKGLRDEKQRTFGIDIDLEG